jgi:hypothetical protein
MSSDRDDRVDMLDLLINLLKEHEKKMDELTYRLETLLDERTPPTESPRRAPEGISGVVARVSSWREFKRQCTGALSVAVEIDEHRFKVTALSRNILFAYEEEIPVLEVIHRDVAGERRETTYAVTDAALTLKSLMGSLDCGLELDRRVIDSTLPDGGAVQRVVYYLDPGAARSWLADQLAVEESLIILGALSLRED